MNFQKPGNRDETEKRGNGDRENRRRGEIEKGAILFRFSDFLSSHVSSRFCGTVSRTYFGAIENVQHKFEIGNRRMRGI
jgi:hypothetical protein